MSETDQLAATFERVFIAHRASGGKKATVTSYRETTRLLLRHLRDTLNREPLTGDFTLLAVQEWLAELAERLDAGTLARDSLRSHAVRTRAISRRLFDSGLIESHRLERLPTPRRDLAAELRVPARSEIAALLEACDPATRGGRLDRALVAVLSDGGPRRSELASLDVVDFDRDGAWIRLRQPAKRGVRRYVMLGSATRAILTEYIGRRTSGPLFLDRRLARLSGNAIAQRVRDVSVRAGLERTIGPQLLRRFAASEVAARGVNDPMLHRIFGWTPDPRKVAWTAYINVRPEQMAELYRTVSPVDQLIW